jgi:glycosyltransferase involved in cell wall biosynthesis
MEEGKDINLLMIVGLFHPFVGGAEKECQKLSKKLMERGISVTVLTQHSDGLPEYEEVGGIPVYRKIKGWHLFELTYMISVLHFLLKHRKEFDIIQCFGLYLFIPPALLMKYLFGRRVIARLECSGRFGDFWRISQLRWKRLIMVSSRRLDKIIFISHDIRKELVENQFSLKRLVYIPNSVDISLFKPSENHGNRNSKNICFVGRLEVQKGVEYLIKAMDVIKSEKKDTKLFIIGDGQLRTPLEELCKKLELNDYINFAGSVNNVLPYYHNSKIFVLPSISEGMPLTLLEAMSCGLPVIVTLVGGNKEILDSNLETGRTKISHYNIGEYGILVNPEDIEGLAKAILKLLKDEELAKQLGEKARKLVENKFSLEKITNDYVDLYHSLM